MPSYSTARATLEIGKWLVILAILGALYQFWYVTLPVAGGLLILWWIKVGRPRRIQRRAAAVARDEFGDSLVELRQSFLRQQSVLGDRFENVRSAAQLVVNEQFVAVGQLKRKVGLSTLEANETIQILAALRIVNEEGTKVTVDRALAPAFNRTCETP
ncbi:MAG: hypothetical protein JWR04_917 [Rhodoglobus sp.]|nr:hypothetical protein [Rhodoglobus sp.]